MWRAAFYSLGILTVRFLPTMHLAAVVLVQPVRLLFMTGYIRPRTKTYSGCTACEMANQIEFKCKAYITKGSDEHTRK